MDKLLQTPNTDLNGELKQIESQFSEIRPNRQIDSQPIDIAFAISLKSKTVSRNWLGVQDSLAKTLRSIMSNTDPNFHIFIAGHERPDIIELQDNRVTWLQVTFPPPEDPPRYCWDRHKKRLVIGAHLRKIGFSGYFMPIDADDWVHYRFIEFIRSQPVTDAFIMNQGFMVNLVNQEVWTRKRFYVGCGSSSVFYFSNEDFPLIAKKIEAKKTPFRCVIKHHGEVVNYLQEISKRYQMVEVPFVTWVLGHGDNNSIIKGKKDDRVSAKQYNAKGEILQDWFYEYFRIKP
jgi:hypothetical protein